MNPPVANAETDLAFSLQPSALSLLRRLEWRVRHAVENVLSGEYRSAFRGRGMEFDQVVRYEFGDDVRDIDWNVTARLGEPYRKKFVEEREVTVMVVLDDTPSLQFGSGTLSKREAVLELAGMVMLLGAVNRDRVGFIHVTPHGHSLREPVRGRGPILHAAASLLGAPAPALEAIPHSALRTPHSAIPWRLITRAVPRHSVVVWLGDFPPQPPPDGWVVLQRRFQMMGFRVDDPWDRGLPAGEVFAAYDPVAGRLVTLEGSAAERAAHATWQREREESWEKLFPGRNRRLVVGTNENRLEALVRFFRARMGAAAR